MNEIPENKQQVGSPLDRLVICECCEERQAIQEYDGEMQCAECIIEAMEYEEGQLFVRDMLHDK